MHDEAVQVANVLMKCFFHAEIIAVILALCCVHMPAEAAVIWVDGVTETSGWYDANKSGPDEPDGDNELCFAASAANLVAWWQERYELDSSVPKSIDDIWTTYKNAAAVDEGGDPVAAIQWWISGVYLPTKKEEISRSIYAEAEYSTLTSTTGYYYDQYKLNRWSTKYYIDNNNNEQYDEGIDEWTSYPDAISDFLYHHNEILKGELTISEGILSLVGMGCGVGLSLADTEDAEMGHAITLWGVDYDAESKDIQGLYLTDSDDVQYGDNEEGLFKVRTSLKDGKLFLEGYWGSSDSVYVSGIYGIDPSVSDGWGIPLVPEPASASLSLVALSLLSLRRRRC